MGHPLVAAELELAADLVSSRIAWTDLVVGPGDASSGPLVDTALVASGSPAGQAVLDAWRERTDRTWARTYGEPQPPHVAATFVLGWYLDALAAPAAWAAVLGPWLLDVSPGAVVVAPHPTQGYPARLHLRADADHQVVAAPELRLRRARERYLAHAEVVARDYAPDGVRMSSHQRRGLVRDAWEMALRAARSTAGSPLVTPMGDTQGDWRRASCCFIYALPGATTCTTCPRRARRPLRRQTPLTTRHEETHGSPVRADRHRPDR